MSAQLLSTMDVRKVGARDWQFTAPMIILVVLDGVSYLIRVPNGFVTDFASVPRIPLAFWLFGGIGDYGAASHDWLYTVAEYPREVCDAIYREILVCIDGTSSLRADLMHAGVRLGGESHYGRKP